MVPVSMMCCGVECRMPKTMPTVVEKITITAKAAMSSQSSHLTPFRSSPKSGVCCVDGSNEGALAVL
jgi:hypothetical protein